MSVAPVRAPDKMQIRIGFRLTGRHAGRAARERQCRLLVSFSSEADRPPPALCRRDEAVYGALSGELLAAKPFQREGKS